MHASRWLLGIWAVSVVTVGGIAGGCSSGSSTPPAAEDASAEAAGDDGATANCHVDASLMAFAASDAAGAGCAACVQTMCQDGIMACSNSCTCVDLFSCLADAGVSATGLTSDPGAVTACIPGGIASAMMLLHDPGIGGIYTCLTMTCGDECASVIPTPEAGTTDGGGGSTEAGASTDSGGTAADAGDGG